MLYSVAMKVRRNRPESWIKCARCGEHFPVVYTHFSFIEPTTTIDISYDKLAAQNIPQEEREAVCPSCSMVLSEITLELLVKYCGWSKIFQGGEWHYKPPEGVGE